MGRVLVPATIVVAMAAFAVAAMSAGYAAYEPIWWAAAVQLAVLGGIVPMIFAVTIRIVPVFARRQWASEAWLRVQVGAAVGGAWVVWSSRIGESATGVMLGHALALVGGVAYMYNIARLFRQQAGLTPALPTPNEGQVIVDKLATAFTRLAGVYLLVGLAIGVLLRWWEPSTGRWDLVWAHALLVGYFLSMASGVCYHVLARWTGKPWRWPSLVRWHLLLVTVGLPFMLIALATEWAPLFAVAGPLQTVGIILLLANIVPMLPALPPRTGVAMAIAGAFLLVGVSLGGLFAIDPALGARLRLAHADLNLFGWTGLLICGVGYYLIPRLLGSPLRWPRLATIQLALLGGGVALSAVAQTVRAYGDLAPALAMASHTIVAMGFVLFGGLIAATARSGHAHRTTTALSLKTRRSDAVLRA